MAGWYGLYSNRNTDTGSRFAEPWVGCDAKSEVKPQREVLFQNPLCLFALEIFWNCVFGKIFKRQLCTLDHIFFYSLQYFSTFLLFRYIWYHFITSDLICSLPLALQTSGVSSETFAPEVCFGVPRSCPAWRLRFAITSCFCWAAPVLLGGDRMLGESVQEWCSAAVHVAEKGNLRNHSKTPEVFGLFGEICFLFLLLKPSGRVEHNAEVFRSHLCYK